MKIKQKQILRSIFSLKGNFTPGIVPAKKSFDGVEIAPYWNGCRTAVSISADFELNWAFRSLNADHRDQLGATERQNVPYILDMLNEFGVPITWATVGHLFLSSCKSQGGHPHWNMPRPAANTQWQGDWYKHDPCSDLPRDPLWYAPDLIEQIMRAKLTHEIASHSFSHIDFSPQTADAELVKREMEESLAAMTPFGVKLRSLVFPFNSMGHSYHDLLHQFGIIAVRHRDEKVRLSYPARSASGVYKIYESMNLRSSAYYNYQDKAKLFINQAITNHAAYHLWFHPSDPRTTFAREFYEILQIIQHEREAGNAWVATMGDLAAYCEARECISIQSSTETNKRTLQIHSSLDTKKYGTPEITLLVSARTMPRSVERRTADAGHTHFQTVCNKRNDTLVLNIPAVTQTITLSF